MQHRHALMDREGDKYQKISMNLDLRSESVQSNRPIKILQRLALKVALSTDIPDSQKSR